MEDQYLPSWHSSKPEKTHQKNRFKFVLIPLFAGMILGLIGLGIYLFQDYQYQNKLKEIGDTTPYSVKFTSIGSDSFRIVWRTKKPTLGFIKYGTSSRALDLIGQSEQRSAKESTYHEVFIDGLDSGQKYFVEIHSNALAYGEKGDALSVTTLD